MKSQQRVCKSRQRSAAILSTCSSLGIVAYDTSLWLDCHILVTDSWPGLLESAQFSSPGVCLLKHHFQPRKVRNWVHKGGYPYLNDDRILRPRQNLVNTNIILMHNSATSLLKFPGHLWCGVGGCVAPRLRGGQDPRSIAKHEQWHLIYTGCLVCNVTENWPKLPLGFPWFQVTRRRQKPYCFWW